jgi:hypothetical protein
VAGNHDLNFDAMNDRDATTTFETVYGPPYYSFDYGHVHFIVLDDVVWRGKVEDPGAYRGGNYTGGLGPDQLQFIRRDLELIDPRKMVVLFMHIPLTAEWMEDDRSQLFRMLEQRPFCLSVSAHYHTHENVFLTEEHGWRGSKPHHHVINGTTCGSWWSGAPDEQGIPHTTMRDGTPNGYSVLSFQGIEYTLSYVPARRPEAAQMHVWAPEGLIAGQADSVEFLANIYNGTELSKVDFRVMGVTDWMPMEGALRLDPFYVEAKRLEDGQTPQPGRPLPKAAESSHIWRGILPPDLKAGQYVLEVREIDMRGWKRLGRRAIRVE